MRLGGSIAARFETAAEWGEHLKKARFASVGCPVAYDAPEAMVADILNEAKRLNVTVAEVGVWRNTLALDRSEREAALTFAKKQLAFADEIGVKCCVNIVGSRAARWDGPHRDNYSEETYAEIVRSIQEIIDGVKPTQAFFTIEPMPWMVPDGPDVYLQLLKDVDREQFAVHMDFVNMINSAKRFLFAEEFIEECFTKLHHAIKSCHIKDVRLEEPLPTVLKEVPPGKGQLNYGPILRVIDRFMPKDTPVLLEHMHTDEEYAEAYDYLAGIADREGIPLR